MYMYIFIVDLAVYSPCILVSLGWGKQSYEVLNYNNRHVHARVCIALRLPP